MSNKYVFLLLFEGLAGMCGGGVLGIVSPALLDDQDSPSTCLARNGFKPVWNIMHSVSEAVGVRSPEAVSVSLRFPRQ